MRASARKSCRTESHCFANLELAFITGHKQVGTARFGGGEMGSALPDDLQIQHFDGKDPIANIRVHRFASNFPASSVMVSRPMAACLDALMLFVGGFWLF